MNIMSSTFALILLSLASTLAQADEYPDIQSGMCGPAKSVNNYLDGAGFFLETTMVALAPDGAHMVYLPKIARVKHMKENGRINLGIEKVEVLHTDSSREHPEGWRCITSVSIIIESDRKALTEYLDAVNNAIK